MGIIDKAIGMFRASNQAQSDLEKIALEYTKAHDDIGRIIAPVFREIPPESKAGMFLTEGFRSWVYIAVSAIADEIATSPIKLFSKSGSDWEEIESHPALSLIEKPNAFQTKEDFFWLVAVYWLVEGEAPIYINKPKNPTEMVLLNPEKLSIQYDEKSIIGGYRYKQADGKETVIPADSIIMLKIPSVNSPFRGSGILRYISQTLDIDNFIDEYLKMFFFNDATPGAVLETEQELNKAVVERVKQQFTMRHRGVRNSHKLSVLEKGLKYHKITSGVNEIQLKELEEVVRDKVLAAFRVPKSVLGIVEDVNRANAEASDYTFAKRAVLPRLRMLESQLNQFVLPKITGGDRLWYEYESPVSEDVKQKAEIYASAITAGWMTVDEVRAEEGFEPMGDEIDEEEDETEEETTGKYAKPKAQNRKRKEKRPDALTEIMKDIIESESPTLKMEYSDKEVDELHEKKVMFSDLLEESYVMKLLENFVRQEKYLLKQISGKTAKKKEVLNIQLDMEKEVAEMIRISNPVMAEAVIKESGLVYSMLGVHGTLTEQDEVVKRFLAEYTLRLAESSTKTTQEKVDRIVKEWNERGGDWGELRSDLRDYFEGKGENGASARADMIARTEISRSAGFAQQVVYEEVGAVGKKWITAKDERTCPICSAVDGMIVPVKSNYFDKGQTLPDGTKAEYSEIGSPPLHPRCRCDMIPVFSEKSNESRYRKAFESVAERVAGEKAREDAIRKREEALEEENASIAGEKEKLDSEKKAVKKMKTEAKKAKENAESELAKIEEYSNSL